MVRCLCVCVNSLNEDIVDLLCNQQLCMVFQDNSLEFEKRRNIPVKYKRELWDKTGNVQNYALKRIVQTLHCFLTFNC